MISYKNTQWRPPSKKKKRGKNLSPKKHRVSTQIERYILAGVADWSPARAAGGWTLNNTKIYI
jgi:hypothetical protein